ncbi:hypothetical protein Droror1_Dr00024652 [Drosera rotundifolia]
MHNNNSSSSALVLRFTAHLIIQTSPHSPLQSPFTASRRLLLHFSATSSLLLHSSSGTAASQIPLLRIAADKSFGEVRATPATPQLLISPLASSYPFFARISGATRELVVVEEMK